MFFCKKKSKYLGSIGRTVICLSNLSKLQESRPSLRLQNLIKPVHSEANLKGIKEINNRGRNIISSSSFRILNFKCKSNAVLGS